MSLERQTELMKAIGSFKLDKESIGGELSSQKVNNFFAMAGGLTVNILKIVIPFIVLAILKQQALIIALSVGYSLILISGIMTFFNKRSLNKKMQLEFEKFQKHLKDRGFSEREMKEIVNKTGGIPLN